MKDIARNDAREQDQDLDQHDGGGGQLDQAAERRVQRLGRAPQRMRGQERRAGVGRG